MSLGGIKPIVIIGAARSGTNMLRDVLDRIPGFGTWPCDEINYIWRHGNACYPSDEFSPEMASEQAKKYIRRAFVRIARKQKADYVVEKTCANSLRIPYVNKIIPEAKFVFIFRDGRDAVLSAMKKYETFDLFYSMRKARFIPVSDIPYYIVRFFLNRIESHIFKRKKLVIWGPRFQGIEAMAGSSSLLELCGVQWARCVEKAIEGLGGIDEERIYKVKYEEFVNNPTSALMSLSGFLGIRLESEQAVKYTQGVIAKSVGNWKKEFDEHDLGLLDPVIEQSMVKLGYRDKAFQRL